MMLSTANVRSTIRVLVYASFLTPLLFFPSYFIFPYIVPKIVFFRTLIVVASCLLSAAIFTERKYNTENNKPKEMNLLSWMVFFYFASLVWSMLAGVDWYRSFWDTEERMLGVFTLLHYGLLFWVCRRVFPDLISWRRPLVVFLSTSVAVLFLGVIQKISPDFLYNQGADRVSATLGNAIYFGGLGIFVFFLGLALGLTTEAKMRWYFFASSILGLWAVLASETRGSLLGVIAGLLVLAMAFVLFKSTARAKKIVLISGVALLVLFSFAWVARESKFVSSIPVVGTLTHISPYEGTAKTRLMAWQIAIKSWRERPVFGFGPNNFFYAFNKNYNPQFLTVSFQETWFDNAHNVFVNTLATLGLVGFLFYVGIYATAAGLCLRVLRKNTDLFWYAAPLCGFLTAHAVHNFFVFENITSYLYFFVVLAFVSSAFSDNKKYEVKNTLPVNVATFVIFLIVSLGIAGATNLNLAKANNHAYNMRGLLSTYRLDEAYARYDKLKWWHSPYQPDIDWDFASDMINIIPNVYQKDNEKAKVLYTKARSGIENVIARFPRDVRARLLYTDVLRAGIVLFDENLTDKINEQFVIANSLSPGRQQIVYSKITFMAGTGKIEEAIDLTKKIVAEYPTIPEGYYHLARLLLYKKDFLAAIPVLDEAINKGVQFEDPVHMDFMGMAYAREGRFKDALYWYDQAAKATKSKIIAKKRDDLAKATQLQIPTSVEAFFPHK